MIKMIEIKLGEYDRHKLKFKDYEHAVTFLRSQAFPWEGCTKSNSNMRYKLSVANRAKIMYGANTIVRTMSDHDFIYDLLQLGEIHSINEIIE